MPSSRPDPRPPQPNTTCDVYRSGVSKVNPPSVAAVPCALLPAFRPGLEAAELGSAALLWTHLLIVDLDTDLRDDYDAGAFGAGGDTVYVPDQNGTGFLVLFVERVGRGTAHDHLRAYLQRRDVTWPTTDL